MSDARRVYPSDLSDAEWALLAPLLPPRAPCGRPRKWPERLIADAVFYVLRSGCASRMLPREFPPSRLPCIAGRPARLGQARRLSTDYERLPAVSEAMIYNAMSRLMLRRLTHSAA